MKGRIFDIQEFAVNDGPGLRVTVFMKGCPLRCKWCHNPEGLSYEPQVNILTGRTVGIDWSADDLIAFLLKYKTAFDVSGGGVTFSGGEATAQFEFVYEVSRRLKLKGIHVNLDTSGYCDEVKFRKLLDVVDLVYFDVKCVDYELHLKMTGVGNELILRNLRSVAESNVDYRIRVPMTKNVADTAENLKALGELIAQLPRKPLGVDCLPCNDLAAAKYKNFGMEYTFNE